MDIREKLRLLDSLPRHRSRVQQKAAVDPTHEPTRGPATPLPRQHAAGSFSLFTEEYGRDYLQGGIRISAYLEKQAQLLALITNSTEMAQLDLRKTLFIDTETTGLSGGVGTCAFLIGVGYFDDQTFTLRQYFMNDFNEEAPLFSALNQLVADFELIVSYNGKSYDIPLLTSRNTYLREKSPYAHLHHFDLLHTVRRLWGRRLHDCSLQTAERAILNVVRSGDIPGYLIPHRYFQYLRNREFAPMQPILYHNRQDILSMVALTIAVFELFTQPAGKDLAAADLLPVGKILERAGRYHEANQLYQSHLANCASDAVQKDILVRIAFNNKKLENWTAAEKAWRECVHSGKYHPLPFIELAKHYEHRTKNLSEARTLVMRALAEMETLDALGRIEDWQEYREDLAYRLKRLQRKLGDA